MGRTFKCIKYKIFGKINYYHFEGDWCVEDRVGLIREEAGHQERDWHRAVHQGRWGYVSGSLELFHLRLVLLRCEIDCTLITSPPLVPLLFQLVEK